MAEDQGKEEEKQEFTPEGETLGYISLDQARVLAMRTARETPGAYGRRFADIRAFYIPRMRRTYWDPKKREPWCFPNFRQDN